MVVSGRMHTPTALSMVDVPSVLIMSEGGWPPEPEEKKKPLAPTGKRTTISRLRSVYPSDHTELSGLKIVSLTN